MIQGKITTIGPTLQKVYVKTLMGMRPYILMEEFSTDIIFLKDYHAASLSYFSEGEQVIVQWRDTKDVQAIELIEAFRSRSVS